MSIRNRIGCLDAQLCGQEASGLEWTEVDRVEGAQCGLRPTASVSPARRFAHSPFRLPPAVPFELNI